MGADIMTEGQAITIVCMRWGEVYAPAYVHILKSAVQKHLQSTHRFVCLTDDPQSLDGRVETRPLPEIEAGPRERGWNKIALFKPELYDIQGAVLFLDLDIVILNDLSPFLEASGKLCIIREWKTLGAKMGLVRYEGGNSSVFRFEVGAQSQIYDAFCADPEAAQRLFRNEQRFLSAHAEGMAFWQKDLCMSFKRDCMAPFPAHFLFSPQRPAQAAIAVFHGKPCPHELIHNQFWGRKTRRGYGAVPWVRDYWQEHSGS